MRKYLSSFLILSILLFSVATLGCTDSNHEPFDGDTNKELVENVREDVAWGLSWTESNVNYYESTGSGSVSFRVAENPIKLDGTDVSLEPLYKDVREVTDSCVKAVKSGFDGEEITFSGRYAYGGGNSINSMRVEWEIKTEWIKEYINNNISKDKLYQKVIDTITLY